MLAAAALISGIVFLALSADKFVEDFVAAWNKVMMLDRFELEAIARGSR